MNVEYTLASRMSLWEDASTMFRTWNRLIALSFGTQRAQLEQRTMAVCPRPCFERPLFRRLDGIFGPEGIYTGSVFNDGAGP